MLPLFSVCCFQIFTELTQLAIYLQNMEGWFRHLLSFPFWNNMEMTAVLVNDGKKYFLTNPRIFDIIYIVKERRG